MALRFMLDTNVISALVREPQGRVATRIAAVGEEAVCSSIVVAAELRFGALKADSKRLRQRVEQILGALNIVPLDVPVDFHYGEIRRWLERKGQPIGPNDLLIAAHARALGLVLVTDNTREFARVPGLRIENWIAAQRR